jgi:hypothetical protein
MVAEVPATTAPASPGPRVGWVRHSCSARGVASPALRCVAWLGALAVAAALASCDDVDNAGFDSAYHSMTTSEVTVRGTVTSLLADAPAGADGPHQRFDIVVDGIGVEIDHNLDLAQRVPVAKGDTVVIHGQFEPDPGHPVIHYTHHATGDHEGGWIQWGGSTYQ